MQLTTTKYRIYQVRCTCYLSSILSFFLDWQFRGDVAILVFLKTMTSYNPTSLIPSLVTEVPVLSQESERSCICVMGISNLSISTIFLLIVWNFSDSVIFFFHFTIGCEKKLCWCTGNRAYKEILQGGTILLWGLRTGWNCSHNCGFELKIPKT